MSYLLSTANICVTVSYRFWCHAASCTACKWFSLCQLVCHFANGQIFFLQFLVFIQLNCSLVIAEVLMKSLTARQQTGFIRYSPNKECVWFSWLFRYQDIISGRYNYLLRLFHNQIRTFLMSWIHLKKGNALNFCKLFSLISYMHVSGKNIYLSIYHNLTF